MVNCMERLLEIYIKRVYNYEKYLTLQTRLFERKPK